MFPFCYAVLTVYAGWVTHSTENSEVVSQGQVPYLITFTRFSEVWCPCLNQVEL